MALASAGCEMPSSSYTAGPRPQLPGLWAAELASVASTQALQRAWQAGLRGRRQRKERLGTSQEQAGQVRRWLRSGEARARMAGRAGSYASHAQARPQLTVWYSGPAARAPELPIEILLTELKAAADRKRNPY